jgi:hypothetical protein
MESELVRRPKWEIDRILGQLLGQDIRVAAESFSPFGWNGQTPIRLIPTRELVLPDNSRAQGLPLYCEGRLERFVRQVGVVHVALAASSPLKNSVEGVFLFRGKTAVILRDPVVVKLAFPFRVEKVPLDPGNCWRDLQTDILAINWGQKWSQVPQLFGPRLNRDLVWTHL